MVQIQKSRKKTQNKKGNNKKKEPRLGKCFNYGKPGYQAKDCRQLQRDKTQAAQINIINIDSNSLREIEEDANVEKSELDLDASNGDEMYIALVKAAAKFRELTDLIKKRIAIIDMYQRNLEALLGQTKASTRNYAIIQVAI